VKVLFFSQDGTGVEQLTLALRLRWPDLTPLVVSQGDLALLAVEQEEPDFVMLCDHLPNLGICTAIREIRRFSGTPIIVATEEDDSEMQAVKALEVGADDYIRMPCNLMGWFANPQWDPADWRAQPCAGSAPESLRAELGSQARALSTNGLDVRSFVLDTSYSPPPQRA